MSGGIGGRQRERLFSSCCLRDPIPVGRERDSNKPSHLGFVLDEDDESVRTRSWAPERDRIPDSRRKDPVFIPDGHVGEPVD